MNALFTRILFRRWRGSALLLSGCYLIGISSLQANVAGGGNAGDSVTLEDNGTSAVLANGILSATISKAAASVSSLRFKGQEMVAGGIYYSMDGGKNYRTPAGCQYRVKRRPPTS